MADEFTPTTGQVRDAYCYGRMYRLGIMRGDRVPEFDRWLAAHDREVRRRALADAAAEARRSGGEWTDLWQPNVKLPDMEDFIAGDILALRDLA